MADQMKLQISTLLWLPSGTVLGFVAVKDFLEGPISWDSWVSTAEWLIGFIAPALLSAAAFLAAFRKPAGQR